MSEKKDQFVFKFNDGSTLAIEPTLTKLSAAILDKQKAGTMEVSLPERYIGEIFNAFAKKFFPKYEDHLEKLEEAVDKNDWWMEFIAEWHKDFIEIVKGLYQDDLIRAGNAASELGFPGFIHICAYIMGEQTENMKMAGIREYLNEEYDFSDEIKAKIESCPEFSEL